MDLGGTGRPVIGRFALPAGIKAGAIFSVSQSDPGTDPSGAALSPESQRQERAGLARPSGWRRKRARLIPARSARFDTNVRPDGRFRIEDVSAGKYRLTAEVREPGNGIPGTYGRELASIDTEVVVPEMPGGRSDEPLDVGTIELEPLNPAAAD